jgi:twitching motility protein PilI
MANKEALRELQNRLALRMKQVRSEKAGLSWLAVDCAGQGVLFPLRQAGEIFEMAAIVPVPHTQRWLSGVANLRGGLCAVVDMAGFLGLRSDGAVPAREQARLVVLNPALGTNTALLVDRLEGLRHAADMQPVVEPDGPARPAFAAARWRDAAGKQWQEIDLSELAVQAQFLDVVG